MVEEMCSEQLEKASLCFGNYIRSIHMLLSPVLNHSYKLQDTIGHINLNTVQSSNNGL